MIIPKNNWAILETKTSLQENRLKEILKRLKATIARKEEIEEAITKGFNVPTVGIYNKTNKINEKNNHNEFIIELDYATIEKNEFKTITDLEPFRNQRAIGIFLIGKKPKPNDNPNIPFTIMPWNPLEYNQSF